MSSTPKGFDPASLPGWERLQRIPRLAIALGVFTVVLMVVFGAIWRQGDVQAPGPGGGDPFDFVMRADLVFETWIVARNARIWTQAPWRMFEAEHCAPYEDSLTFGIPMIAAGLYGVPASWVSDSPAAIYNFSLGVSLLLAFLAMYLLVQRWTGMASAGVFAALIYAFHPIRLENIAHPTVWDTTWTVFALDFSERLFSGGRWRHAIALGISCALQIATSFYSLMVATFLALPFVVWLLSEYGLRKVRLVHLAAIAAIVAAAVGGVLVPYLVAGIDRPDSYGHYFFASWTDYLPGHAFSAGVPLYLLAAVALVRGRRGLAISGDPRWALLAGAALLAFLSVGSDSFTIVGSWLGMEGEPWNPYLTLGDLLPGLRAVRGVTRLSGGVLLVACVLGGVGFAAGIRWLPRYAIAVSMALVALAAGMAISQRPVAHPVRASDEEIAFFARLEEMGNAGPVFEVPIPHDVNALRVPQQRILRSFHHGRRTSACFASYRPGAGMRRKLDAELPERAALQEVRDLGFTTLIVEGPRIRPRFIQAARSRPTELQLLYATPRRAAFEILLPTGERTEPPRLQTDDLR